MTNIAPLSTGTATGRLAGKVAFVTGTAGGQGREVARLFCEAGAIVYGADIAAAADRNAETAAIIAAAGGRFITASVDVSDEDNAKAWIGGGVSEAGRIDILYNSAGFAHFGPIDDLTQTQWRETVDCH